MSSAGPRSADPAGASGQFPIANARQPAEPPRSVAADRPLAANRVGTAVVLGCYLLGAMLVTWRLWADPASRMVVGNPQDADQFAWYLRYAATAVADGRFPALVTSALNAPQGVNVMWNTSLLLPAVLLSPVTLLAGPQASLTIVTTVGFAGSAASLFWVLRRWRVSLGAAALAGAVYGFSPALLHAAIGHYNLQLAILPPLIVDAGLRVVVGRPSPVAPVSGPPAGELPSVAPAGGAHSGRARWPSRLPVAVRDGCWLGLLVTAQIFTGEELLLLTGLAGLVAVAVLAASCPRAAVRRTKPALAGLAVAAGVTLALAGRALWVQFLGPLTQHGSAFLPDYFVNDVSGFVTPSRQQLFHSAASAAAAARYQGGPAEYLAYLGWPLIVALLLVTAACWRHPAVRAAALTVIAFEVLSLGGHPLVSGVSHPGVNLPWHWLENLPVLGSALPTRMSIVADGAAATLLALGIDLARKRLAGIRSGRWPAAVTAVAVLACLPLVPRPLASAEVTPLPAGWSAAISALRLAPGARVLVVPVPTPNLTLAMRWQADTGHPDALIGGYFTGPAWNGHAYIGGNGVTATARYLNQLWFAGLPPGGQSAAAAAGAGLAPPGTAPTPSAVRADLTAWRPAAVLAVTTPDSPLGRYLRHLFGPPTTQSGTVMGWRL